MQDLIEGFIQFKRNVYPQDKHLFRSLAGGQKPSGLFITCADSRVVPALITQSKPGRLFVCRTVGNQVPVYKSGGDTAVASSIEYAVKGLGVKDIIVCGHSDCGAMKGLLHPNLLTELPATAAWLKNAEPARSAVASRFGWVPADVELHLATEQNVLAQLENLRTHPAVAKGLDEGSLCLHGWVYHIHSGEITAYSFEYDAFFPLDANPAESRERLRRMEAGAA